MICSKRSASGASHGSKPCSYHAAPASGNWSEVAVMSLRSRRSCGSITVVGSLRASSLISRFRSLLSPSEDTTIHTNPSSTSTAGSPPGVGCSPRSPSPKSRSLSWDRRPEASRILPDLKNANRGWDALVIGEPQRAAIVVDGQGAVDEDRRRGDVVSTQPRGGRG